MEEARLLPLLIVGGVRGKRIETDEGAKRVRAPRARRYIFKEREGGCAQGSRRSRSGEAANRGARTARKNPGGAIGPSLRAVGREHDDDDDDADFSRRERGRERAFKGLERKSIGGGFSETRSMCVCVWVGRFGRGGSSELERDSGKRGGGKDEGCAAIRRRGG